jgi:peptidoglycan/xylan/chitin deacetylase (PgdA/CDA1 family)
MGTFVISLDFELFWGVRDKRTIQGYGKNILTVRSVIPKLLSIFKEYYIHATFATVGFLFFDTKEELILNLPRQKPSYTEIKLSPYNDYLKSSVGKNEATDQFHFAKTLIQQIQEEQVHEIASHTFSHYYCLEKGQTEKEFASDLLAAKTMAMKFGIELKSLVFPRNQHNDNYLKVVQEAGFTSFRGNCRHWIFKARNERDESLIRRALRLIDTYINITGYHCFSYKSLKTKNNLLDITASSFLRPYNYHLRFLESFKIYRIKKSMTHAAKNNLMYHLWWHPHNFGSYQDENFAGLIKILNHYKRLNEKFGFTSLSMGELSDKINKMS